MMNMKKDINNPNSKILPAVYPGDYEELEEMGNNVAFTTKALQSFTVDELTQLKSRISLLEKLGQDGIDEWLKDFYYVLVTVVSVYLELYYGINCQQKLSDRKDGILHKDLYMKIPPGVYSSLWEEKVFLSLDADYEVKHNVTFKYSRECLSWFEAMFGLDTNIPQTESVVLTKMVRY